VTLNFKIRRFSDFSFSDKSGPSRFKEACASGCPIGVSLLKVVISAVSLSSVKMVADRHKHAADFVTIFWLQ